MSGQAWRLISGAVLAICLMTFATHAAPTTSIVSQDSAANSPYDDGLQNGDNGGTGFFAWSDTGGKDDNNAGGTNAGVFVGSSTGNGDGDGNADGDINTSGRAWGTFANSSDLAEGFRGFDFPGSDESLQIGWTFSVRMDNGFIDSGAAVGFGLRNDSGDNRFEFFFAGDDTDYTIGDNETSGDTGIGFTDEGLEINFRLTSADTYNLSVTTLGAGGSTTQFINRSLFSTGGITNFRFFNFNAGSGSSNDAFFNNLIVAAPTPAALPAGLALLALAGMRRRRS